MDILDFLLNPYFLCDLITIYLSNLFGKRMPYTYIVEIDGLDPITIVELADNNEDFLFVFEFEFEIHRYNGGGNLPVFAVSAIFVTKFIKSTGEYNR